MNIQFIEHRWIEGLQVKMSEFFDNVDLISSEVIDIKYYSYSKPTFENSNGVMHVAVIHYEKKKKDHKIDTMCICTGIGHSGCQYDNNDK